MLKFRDLTEREVKLVSNGCGNKGGFVRPPEFFFKASCDQHDFYYWRGGDWRDRLRADFEFYKIMILDIRENVHQYKLFSRVNYFVIATIYFLAVRLFGWKFFSYLDEMRTRKDIYK